MKIPSPTDALKIFTNYLENAPTRMERYEIMLTEILTNEYQSAIQIREKIKSSKNIRTRNFQLGAIFPTIERLAEEGYVETAPLEMSDLSEKMQKYYTSKGAMRRGRKYRLSPNRRKRLSSHMENEEMFGVPVKA
jgi:DNA-binding PadR family transcriptional regulator